MLRLARFFYFSSLELVGKAINVLNTEPTCQSAGQPCVELDTEPGRVHIQTGLCDGLAVVDHLHLSYLLSPALCNKARYEQTMTTRIHQHSGFLLKLIF